MQGDKTFIPFEQFEQYEDTQAITRKERIGKYNSEAIKRGKHH
ncbi:hypothetical protein ACILFQ_01100 [Capnocytophaga canimorsus]